MILPQLQLANKGRESNSGGIHGLGTGVILWAAANSVRQATSAFIPNGDAPHLSVAYDFATLTEISGCIHWNAFEWMELLSFCQESAAVTLVPCLLD